MINATEKHALYIISRVYNTLQSVAHYISLSAVCFHIHAQTRLYPFSENIFKVAAVSFHESNFHE